MYEIVDEFIFDIIEGIALSAIPVTFMISPIIALIFGIVRLVKYNNAKKQQTVNPDCYTDEEIKNIKKSLITAFVTSIILAIVVMSVIYLLNDAIAHM